jgi:hypothetical protein
MAHPRHNYNHNHIYNHTCNHTYYNYNNYTMVAQKTRAPALASDPPPSSYL